MLTRDMTGSGRSLFGWATAAASGIAFVAVVLSSAHTHAQAGRTVTAGAGDVVEIRTTGVELAYSVTTIRAKAGETLTIRYDNTASEMAHNVVLVRTEDDIMPVGTAALAAHATDYIPVDKMDRILGHSALAYPGDIVEWTFVVPPPGTYPYICTYSGHFTMMQGRLISTD
jgi:azurin